MPGECTFQKRYKQGGSVIYTGFRDTCGWWGTSKRMYVNDSIHTEDISIMVGIPKCRSGWSYSQKHELKFMLHNALVVNYGGANQMCSTHNGIVKETAPSLSLPTCTVRYGFKLKPATGIVYSTNLQWNSSHTHPPILLTQQETYKAARFSLLRVVEQSTKTMNKYGKLRCSTSTQAVVLIARLFTRHLTTYNDFTEYVRQQPIVVN
jgi:hypothetical protein